MTKAHNLTQAEVAHIQAACEMLVARYCHCADQREHQAFAEVFAPDGEWVRPGMHMQGREEIFCFMDSRPPALTRHVAGSIHVEVIDADHARGLNYTTVYRAQKYAGGDSARLHAQMVVDYRDEFVRLQGRWHIRKRHTTVIFQDTAPN